MPVGEPTTLTAPLPIIQPENFRRIMQKQIETHVANEINGLTLYLSDTNDGRYSNSKPTTPIQMSNSLGSQYFIVGRSIVGSQAVAAP